MNVEGGEFSNTRVMLDGVKYRNVTFNNCVMVFTGEKSGDMSLVGCSFNNCKWHFEGAAGNALNFINTLANAMGNTAGRKFIKSLFPNHL
ncbi:hypothetical protein [Pantoea eucalypti]|uniref:hypothetical protein n=1 Tax=Pantoea eucalypti TaxID=470933 RepID=UPI003FA46005